MKKTGIYLIYSKNTHKYYVGQSLNIVKRIKAHFYLLSKDKHENTKLTNHVKKYGLADLDFTILKQCPKNELNFYEKFFINSLNCYTCGFNMNEGGEARPIKQRPIFTLKNADTQEEYTGKSIKDFCEKYHLEETNICAVLNGRQNHHFGWYDLKRTWRPQYFTVMNPQKEELVFWKLYEFSRKFNLSPTGLYNLCHKISENHRGWTRKDSVNAWSRASKNRQRPGKKFKLKAPNGDIIESNNLNKFAKDNNLTQQNLYAVVKGTKKSHKGYTRICE